MLEEFSNLGHPDPKISKGAGLKLIQHVVENKGDLNYFVKRLITAMESVKVSTRAGSYTTLTALLSLGKVNPFELFEMMEKCLVTSKESTKKERRLIYIARILCIGSIFRSIPAVNLAKEGGFLPAALKELVELSQKKATYFLLSTPFISHLLQGGTLTQEGFDKLVWPSISVLFGSETKAMSKKKGGDGDGDESTDDEEDDDVNVGGGEKEGEREGSWVKLCCQVQLALDCKNGEYRGDFKCLEEPGKIAKALLASNLQFEDSFLKSLFKHLAAASDPVQIKTFWESLVDNIKSTQFELLCLAVKTSLDEGLPISGILSKKLVRLLLSVFKLEDKDFHKKSRETMGRLLGWGKYKKEKEGGGGKPSLSKKERKSMLKILFDGEEPPSILHEYKFLHPIIRPFILELTSKELDQLEGIIMTNLFDSNDKSKLGPRMAIVYLQILGRLAQCQGASPELRFKIGEKLLNIAFGREEVPIKAKGEGDVVAAAEEGSPQKEAENQPESSLAGTREQIKKCAMDALHLILSSNYCPGFTSLLSSHIIQNSADFTSKPETLKVLKDIKKATKKYTGGRPHLECILRSYGIRVLLDEGQAVSSASENVQTLLELVKEGKEGELTELWRFITGSVVRERYPPFNYEGLFSKLLMEGKVNDEVVQVFAETIDMELEPEEGGEDDDDEDEESDGEEKQSKMEVDDDDSGDASEDEEDGATTTPPKKKTKLELDPAQIAKLKAEMGANSDSEESIALDEATEEDLQKMDGALAKVFGVKKHMKEEERSGERGLMRTLRLVDLYIRRNVKDMPVSSLLILLMPVVHSLQKSLKLRKSQLPTRLIGTLDNLSRVKRFTGCDDVVEGTFATLAGELHEMGLQKKNKLIRELLEHSVILMTRCFLQKEGKRSKKDQKKLIALYCKAVDIAESKIKGRRKITRKRGRNKKGGIGGVAGDMNTSRFVRLALDTFPEWKEGQKAIQERIKSKSAEAK